MKRKSVRPFANIGANCQFTFTLGAQAAAKAASGARLSNY